MISYDWSAEDDPDLVITMHHNGDFSGEVLINVPPGLVTEVIDAGPERFMQVTIPFDALKALVGAYVSGERISALEQASDDDILFGRIP